MPVEQVPGGWRWGKHGKVYPTKAEAEEQGRAIQASEHGRVDRFDRSGRLGTVSRTPTGGVRIPATVARTGVQEYATHDGQMRREYRPSDEVGHADSLASFAAAAVTIGHPGRAVTPDNWDRLSVGTVSDRGARLDALEGHIEQWVYTDLLIQRADAIVLADAGKLEELSVGYSCELDETPGTSPAGEKYDAIQRNIRANHVALLERGCARAGSHARLRLDGSQEPLSLETMPMPTIKVDGVDVEINSPTHVSALTALLVKRDARATELEGQSAKEAATLQAKFDALQKECDGLKAELAKLDELVEARGALLAAVTPVLGKEYSPKGKTAGQIKRDALTKLNPALKLDGKSDVWVDAYFEAAALKTTDFRPLSGDKVAAEKVEAARADKAKSPEDAMREKAEAARKASYGTK